MKVRSTAGLLIHLFGKLSIAFINLIFKMLIRIFYSFSISLSTQRMKFVRKNQHHKAFECIELLVFDIIA